MFVNLFPVTRLSFNEYYLLFLKILGYFYYTYMRILYLKL